MYGRDYHEWREREDALASILTAMPSDPEVRDYVIKALAGGRKTSVCEEMGEYQNMIGELAEGQNFYWARNSFLPQ